MAKIRQAAWKRYRDVINEFHEDVNQADITWHRSLGGLDRYGEDNLGETFEDIPLKCLVNYNFFRTWPLTKTSETGNTDGESLAIYLNKEYLNTLGYLNAQGYFVLSEEADYFTLSGQRYKPAGNTDIAQARDVDKAKDTPLLLLIILKRLSQ